MEEKPKLNRQLNYSETVNNNLRLRVNFWQLKIGFLSIILFFTELPLISLLLLLLLLIFCPFRTSALAVEANMFDGVGLPLLRLLFTILHNLLLKLSSDDDDVDNDDAEDLLRLRNEYLTVRFVDGECALSSYSCNIFANWKSSLSCWQRRFFDNGLSVLILFTINGNSFTPFLLLIPFSCLFWRSDRSLFVRVFLFSMVTVAFGSLFAHRFLVFEVEFSRVIVTSGSGLFSFVLLCLVPLAFRFMLSVVLEMLVAVDAIGFNGWNIENADLRWTEVSFCLNLLFSKRMIIFMKYEIFEEKKIQYLPFHWFE